MAKRTDDTELTRELDEYWSEVYVEVAFLQERFQLPAQLAWGIVMLDQLNNAVHRACNHLEGDDEDDEPWKR